MLSRRWRLAQKLGEGSVGEVYAAEPVAGGSRVAIKVLRPAFASDPVVAGRFLEEGRRRMRMVHPNIARVLECEQPGDGPPFLVSEFLEGVPLGAYTRNGGRVPVGQAVSIAQGMLAGLAAAHAQGFVHRDLKPDNVFLMRQPGGTFAVKVLDFGMADVLDAAAGMGGRARDGSLMGTVAYMSPEQTTPGADVDQRSDVFSAGAILYEMLTGRVAFSAPTEYARLAAVRSTYPEPMEHIDPALLPLGPLVMRALQKAREDRFASALDMARALAAAAASHEALSPSPTEPAVASLGSNPETSLGGRALHTPSISILAASAVSRPVASAFARTTPAPVVDIAGGRVRPGGTLASPIDAREPVDPAPYVPVVDISGTLPSKDLPVIIPMKALRGIRSKVVVALVLAALVVGFALGWAAARLT